MGVMMYALYALMQGKYDENQGILLFGSRRSCRTAEPAIKTSSWLANAWRGGVIKACL